MLGYSSTKQTNTCCKEPLRGHLIAIHFENFKLQFVLSLLSGFLLIGVVFGAVPETSVCSVICQYQCHAFVMILFNA